MINSYRFAFNVKKNNKTIKDMKKQKTTKMHVIV